MHRKINPVKLIIGLMLCFAAFPKFGDIMNFQKNPDPFPIVVLSALFFFGIYLIYSAFNDHQH